MSIFITIIGVLLIAVGAFLTLKESVCGIIPRLSAGTEKAHAESLVLCLTGAVVLTVLSILAAILHWMMFVPIVIVIIGIWQRASYSRYSWLLALGLLCICWMTTTVVTSSIGVMLVAFSCRYIFSTLAAITYILLSNASRKEDRKREEMKSVAKEAAKEAAKQAAQATNQKG